MATSPTNSNPSSISSQAYSRLGTTYNRVLTVEDRARLAETVEELRAIAPDMMARKIQEAVFQQAHCYDIVRRLATVVKDQPVPDVLVVGAYDDPVAMALAHHGFHVEAVDPRFADTTLELGPYKPAVYHANKLQDLVVEHGYDYIVVCSAIEHDGDDLALMRHVCDRLISGGVAVFTMDYKHDWQEGDDKPAECARLYSKARIAELIAIAEQHGCMLAGDPMYDAAENYFSYGGVDYAFASMVIEKR